MIEKADAVLHRSLDRGSSRTAIAVLRGAGVFESRAESIVLYRYQDLTRRKPIEKLEQKSRRDAVRRFGRTAADDRGEESSGWPLLSASALRISRRKQLPSIYRAASLVTDWDQLDFTAT